MLRREKLNYAENNLPPLELPLEQFDLALYFENDYSPIFTVFDDNGELTETSPIRFGEYEYSAVRDIFRDYGLKGAEFENSSGGVTRSIVLTYTTQPTDRFVVHGFFTEVFDASQTISTGLYTNNLLTSIGYIRNSDIQDYIGKWIYFTFMEDGGG